MAVTARDKTLLATAAALAVASAAVFSFLAQRSVRAARAPLAQVEVGDATYAPVASDAPPVKVETWPAPPSQSRGREWIYDTFTPPEIFYHARTRQFTVKPPTMLADQEEEAF